MYHLLGVLSALEMIAHQFPSLRLNRRDQLRSCIQHFCDKVIRNEAQTLFPREHMLVGGGRPLAQLETIYRFVLNRSIRYRDPREDPPLLLSDLVNFVETLCPIKIERRV